MMNITSATNPNVATTQATSTGASVDFSLSESFNQKCALGEANMNIPSGKGLNPLASSSKKKKGGKKENSHKPLGLCTQVSSGNLGSSLIKPVPITNSLASNLDK